MRVTARVARQHQARHRRTLALAATVVVGAALAWSVRAQTAPPATTAAPAIPSAADTAATAQANREARMRLSSTQVQQAFQHLDTNRDGQLSRGEVSVFPRIERHFERMDGNRDGAVSPSEFEQALQQSS